MFVKQITELYNKSVNRVKSQAAELTQNYKKLSSVNEYLEMPSAIEGIAKAAINTFVKGSEEPQSWTAKEDMNIISPVGGTDYSSHLTQSMVKSAVCEETADKYKLSIVLYDDALTSPEKGEGYAGVFNTVTAATFTGINIPGVSFNKVDVKGINGSVKCTIEKSTGLVSEITFNNTDILSLGVKVAFSELNVQFALAVEKNYSIKY